MKKDRSYSRWIGFFAIVLVLVAIVELNFLKNFRYYSFLHQYLPDQLIRLRYYLSLLFRASLFVCGIGIFLRKELFRKLVVLLGVGIIATIYWRHPVQCFVYIFDYLALKDPGVTALRQDIPHIENILMWVNYFIDVLFSGVLIWFFTRPQARDEFTRKKRTLSSSQESDTMIKKQI